MSKIKIRLTYGNSSTVAEIESSTYNPETGNFVKVNHQAKTIFKEIEIDNKLIPEGFKLEDMSEETSDD
jgi:hypothetical protein